MNNKNRDISTSMASPVMAQLLHRCTSPKASFLFPSPYPSFPFLSRGRLRRTVPPRSSGSGSSRNRPSRGEANCPVPEEQLPINEYQSLVSSFPFSWASSDFVEYCSRLLATGLSFAVLVGLPVASFGSAASDPDPFRRFLYVVSSGVIFVSVAVVQMYLGWAYVGNRLLSATVEYEETGWYDGQMWIKTAEVLARDRLLGSFTVKPVLSRLKYTLVTLAVSLLVCAVLLVKIDEIQEKPKNVISKGSTRVIPGVYNDESARSFEPDAFCGGPVPPE